MFKLAFSTNAFKKNTLAEAVDAIADAGYAGVEVMADVPHAHPASFDAAARVALVAQLAARRMPVSNVNAFTHFADGDTYRPTWLDADPARRAVRVSHTIGAVALAAGLGAKTVSLQPGGPLIGTGLTWPTAAALYADGLRQVLPHAVAAGVTLAVEPEPGLLIETAAEYAAFKAEFFPADPAVAMNCDVGHLFCVGDDPAAVIRARADQIAHVHLEDIGANRVHQHLTPGKGVIDFPCRLRRTGRDRLRRLGHGRTVPVRDDRRRRRQAGNRPPAPDVAGMSGPAAEPRLCFANGRRLASTAGIGSDPSTTTGSPAAGRPTGAAHMRGVISIVIGGVMIVGGLTGRMVLIGTHSSAALAAAGAAVVVIGIVRLTRGA